MLDNQSLNSNNPENDFDNEILNSSTARNLINLCTDSGLECEIRFYPFTQDTSISYVHFSPYVAADDIANNVIFYIPADRFKRSTNPEDDAVYYMPAVMSALYAEKYGSIFARDYYSETIDKDDLLNLKRHMRLMTYVRELWAVDKMYGYDNMGWRDTMEFIPELAMGLAYKNSETPIDSPDFEWGVFMQLAVNLASLVRFKETGNTALTELFDILDNFRDPRIKNQFIFFFNYLLKTTPLDETQRKEYNHGVLQFEANRALKATGSKSKIKLVSETQLYFREGHTSRWAWALV